MPTRTTNAYLREGDTRLVSTARYSARAAVPTTRKSSFRKERSMTTTRSTKSELLTAVPPVTTPTSGGNGAHSNGHRAATPPPATRGVTRRPSLEELKAAVGPQTGGIKFGKIEERYECSDKIEPGVYFRAHPNRDLWQDTTLLVDVDNMDKAAYLVAPEMQIPLHLWVKRVLLVPCMNQDHKFFLLRIALSDITMGQRQNASEKTRLQAVEAAVTKWTTIIWAGKRHVFRSADDDGKHLGEPDWPEDLTTDLINWRAFQDYWIGDDEHPIAKVYLGLARR